MKKKIVSMLVCLCMLVSLLPIQASAAGKIAIMKPKGIGTINRPYEISNAGELYWFAGVVNGTLDGELQNQDACAVLTADITVNPNVVNQKGELVQDTSGLCLWNSIGNGASRREGGYNEYRGVFDGKNHVINGLYFDDAGKNQVGIFGLVKGGKISNLTLRNSWLGGGTNVGGICGSVYGNSQILNCRNEANIFGFSHVGGITGGCLDGKIEKSANSGTISVRYNSESNCCGGIAGTYERSDMKDCWNVGTIICEDIGGGLVGDNGDNSTISDSYNYGKVIGARRCGAVIGKNYSNTKVVNCYYDESTNPTAIGTNYGSQQVIYGKTKAEFQSGEVCSLLNKGITDGSQAWYQNLDNSQKTDLYPRLSGGTVYKNGTSFSNYTENIIQVSFKKGVDFSKTYDGKPILNPSESDLVIVGKTSQKPTFTWYQVSDSGLVELSQAPINVGIYKVMAYIPAAKDSSAAKAVSGEIRINQQMTTGLNVELEQETFAYDGKKKEPGVTVYKDKKKIPSEEYTVSYKNNQYAGTASVIIESKPSCSYKFYGSKNFQITIDMSTITVEPVKKIIQKTCDGMPFDVSNENGIHLKWTGTETAVIAGYYLDANGTCPTNMENAGSEKLSGAPVKAGKYYVVVYVQVGNESSKVQYIPFEIVDSNGFPFPGNGTESNPYEIRSEEALVALEEIVMYKDNCSGRFFKLCNDVEYSKLTILQDGKLVGGKPFCGNFNGNGFNIKLQLTRSSSRLEMQLFSKLGNNATIMNLSVSGSITAYPKFLGGIVGTVDGTNVKIMNCTSDVELIYTNSFRVPDCTYGGIVGTVAKNGELSIQNCSFTGAIYSNPRFNIEGVGGLCGWNEGKVSAENCYVDAELGSVKGSARGSYMVRNGASIRNCYFNEDQMLTVENPGMNQGTGMRTSDFCSGKVAYLLNDSVHNKTESIWGQVLSGENPNANPILLFDKGDSRNWVHQILLIPGPNMIGGLPENMSGDYYVNANLQLPQLTEEQKEQGYSYAIQNDKTAATLDSTRNCIENIQEDLTVQVLLKRPQMYRIQCEVGSVKGGTVEGIRESGYQYNEEATLTVQTLPGFLFVGWKNQNGEIVSTKENYQFKVTDHHSLTVLFVEKKAEETYHTVEFYHQAGNLLKADKVIKNQTVIPPNTPTKAGFDFIGWSADGINPMATNADGSITIASNYTLRPLFKAKEETFKVFVNGNQQGSYKLMTQVTVQILAEQIPEGKQFAYWTDQAGNIVSYNNPYQFYLTGETSLIPVYQDKIAEVKKMPTLHLSAPVYEGVTAGKHKMTWFSIIDLPENYTVVDCGVLRMLSNNALPNELMNMNTSGIFKRQIQLSSSMPNQYYYSVTAADGRGISLRAYMVVKNSEGVYETIYSQVEFGCYK